MKTVMLATEVGSTFTYKENYMGKAVYSTLDKGQYAIDAKVKLTNSNGPSNADSTPPSNTNAVAFGRNSGVLN